MSLTQQLELAAITEPAPVSQWPAVGWWFLGGLTLLLSLAGICYGIKYWRKHQRLKRSLLAIERVSRKMPANMPTANICGRFNIVLKQHLLQAGLHQALPLHGKPWREFLQQHTAAKYHNGIAEFVGQLYQPDRYQPDRHEQAGPTTSSARLSLDSGVRSSVERKESKKPEPVAQWRQQVTAWLKALPC